MNVTEEIWRSVVGFESSYEVSTFGNVRNIKTNRLLKGSINSGGYVDVKLYGKYKPRYISKHILVAMSFLGYVTNGTKYLVVDHFDENKTNNNLSNLQIITHRENVRKSIKKIDTPYYGVYKNKYSSTKWRARITFKNICYHIGYFNDDYEAHLAVERKLKELNDNIL